MKIKYVFPFLVGLMLASCSSDNSDNSTQQELNDGSADVPAATSGQTDTGEIQVGNPLEIEPAPTP